MKNIATNPIILYAAIVILIFLYVDSCQRGESEENRYQTNLRIQQDSIRAGRTRLGQVTAERDAMVVTNEELREELWVKDDSLQDLLKNFRKVQAAFVINTEVNLEPATVSLTAPNDLGERTFRKRTPHYFFSGTVLPNSVRLDTLSMFNTQRLVLGINRGFFNRTISAEITNSNPYIRTTDMATQVVEERVRRWGLSAYFGYGLGQNLTLTPQVGVGLTWDFIRF